MVCSSIFSHFSINLNQIIHAINSFTFIVKMLYIGYSPSTASGVTTGNVSNNSSNRRKSVGHIPLSPLARTPSPSPLPASPTRSPSPLAFPVIVHQPGKLAFHLYSNYLIFFSSKMYRTQSI